VDVVLMAWILVPSLVSLRNEFNAFAPARDKATDGSVGDPAHAQSPSDHNPDETGKTPSEDADDTNEVHAIDVDADLRKPGWTMGQCVDIIVLRHRRGQDDRLQNVIYNRTIWSRSWGWAPREYIGPNPHTQHAHFGARYTTAQESDTRHWGLLEADVALSTEDKAWIDARINAVPAKTWTAVSWNGETAAVRLAKAAVAAEVTTKRVNELDVQMDAYAAEDAARDATLPTQVREALGAGQSPEQVAAALKQVKGVDWAAVAPYLQG
jgi:hypothetical protein